MKRVLKAMSMALKFTIIMMLGVAIFVTLVCAILIGLCSLGIGYVLSSFLTVFISAFVSIVLFEFITDNL